jgi:hypothetical protein
MGCAAASRLCLCGCARTGFQQVEIKQGNLLAPWKKDWGDCIREDAFVETLYNSLSGQKTGKFIPHN